MVLLKLGQRGTLTLPKQLRAGLPNEALLEAVKRDDGVIELRPQTAVDASQTWFWSERWQRMERETEADYAAGRFKTFHDTDSFLADLDSARE